MSAHGCLWTPALWRTTHFSCRLRSVARQQEVFFDPFMLPDFTCLPLRRLLMFLKRFTAFEGFAPTFTAAAPGSPARLCLCACSRWFYCTSQQFLSVFGIVVLGFCIYSWRGCIRDVWPVECVHVSAASVRVGERDLIIRLEVLLYWLYESHWGSEKVSASLRGLSLSFSPVTGLNNKTLRYVLEMQVGVIERGEWEMGVNGVWFSWA